MGQTVVDWWGVTDRPRNVHLVREVDDDAFFALLVERLGKALTRGAPPPRAPISRPLWYLQKMLQGL